MRTSLCIAFILIFQVSFAQWKPTNGPNTGGSINSMASNGKIIIAGTYKYRVYLYL